MNVLVIESDFQVGKLFEEAFRLHGFCAKVVSEMNNVVPAIIKGNTDLLIICHYDSREQDGIALSFEVREKFPHLPVILIPISCLPSSVEHRANAVIPKPFTLNTVLGEAVRLTNQKAAA